MGGVLQSWARICAVPKHGTGAHKYLRHKLANIACFRWHRSKGCMDDADRHGYFRNVRMTESFGVEMEPLPLSPLISGAWGKEPN
jgi:hypothetical protein